MLSKDKPRKTELRETAECDSILSRNAQKGLGIRSICSDCIS